MWRGDEWNVPHERTNGISRSLQDFELVFGLCQLCLKSSLKFYFILDKKLFISKKLLEKDKQRQKFKVQT